MKITKEFTFCASHMLSNYDGKCANLHGHNYKLKVTLEGEVIGDKSNNEYGMIMDFGTLKSIVNNVIEPWDHSFIVDTTDKKQILLSDFMKNNKICKRFYHIDCRTTAENMINIILLEIKNELEIKGIKNIETISVKLWETPTSYSQLEITL
jgi:6-pyruvoyltetrahydropterin/6-carboxytetrahydropterin synthase